jgi:Lysozyme like domain
VTVADTVKNALGGLTGAQRFNLSNWTTGQTPSMTEALGLSANAPQITPLTASAVTQAQAAPGSSTGSGDAPALPKSGSYSFSQLEQIWVDAGGNPSVKTIAAAIAMAESGGNPEATDDDSNGSTDRGLWQINSTHGSQSTYNVIQNARAAVAISSNGTNWSPWTTYKSGAYLEYMPEGGS